MKIEAGTPRRRLKILGAFLLLSAVLITLVFVGPGVAEKWRLARAKRYQEELSPKLAQDPRYREVHVELGSTEGGAVLFVTGKLSSNADLESLIGLVESTHSPVPVIYRVRVVIEPK